MQSVRLLTGCAQCCCVEYMDIAVNYDHDPLGCKNALHYGEAYLQLQNVQDRATFTWGDSAHVLQELARKAGGSRSSRGSSLHVSSSAAREVVTFGVWQSRILSAMSWSDLQLLHKLSCGTEDKGTVKLSKYLEFQIHGPVRFAEDVAKIVIPEKYRAKHEALAKEFAATFHCALEWPGPAGVAASAASRASTRRGAF